MLYDDVCCMCNGQEAFSSTPFISSGEKEVFEYAVYLAPSEKRKDAENLIGCWHIVPGTL
jgi:hypothetical protein